jgi:acetamidase/formamidase
MGAASAAEGPPLEGRWEITTAYAGGTFVAGLDLHAHAGAYTGKSGYLFPDQSWYHYSGMMQADGLHLTVFLGNGSAPYGEIVLIPRKDSLSGKGTVAGVPVTLSGRRPLQRPPDVPRMHDYDPQVFYTTFAAGNPPALHIFPGDTVRTRTVDAAGGGNASQRTRGGNPLTGPFYVEGAMIGDTIAVHFNRIRPNRDTAFQYRATLADNVVPPGYPQHPVDGWSNLWKLDRERGIATPVNPSDKLRNLALPIRPMLGCVGVAPYWQQAISSSDLGPYGGNLDYNQIREGTTVHLPVYEAGALLAIGDGHAAQADGEITYQGLETSMDVEFTVELTKDQLLDQPWAENQDSIMVFGIGGSLEAALQNATAGMSNWLSGYYGLSSSEVATFLAAYVHYDIAVVTDPEAHVVARVSREALAQLPKPPAPASLFCQPRSGCSSG